MAARSARQGLEGRGLAGVCLAACVWLVVWPGLPLPPSIRQSCSERCRESCSRRSHPKLLGRRRPVAAAAWANHRPVLGCFKSQMACLRAQPPRRASPGHSRRRPAQSWTLCCSQLETQTRAAEFSQAVATARTSITGNSRVSAQGSILAASSSTTPSHHDRMKPRHTSAAICQGEPLTLSSTRQPDWRMAARPSLRWEQPSADRGALRDDRRWGCLGLALPETPRRRSDWPAAAEHAIHPVTPRSGLGRPRRCRTWPSMARPWAADGSPLSPSAQASPAACSFVTSAHHLLRLAGGCPWAAPRAERRGQTGGCGVVPQLAPSRLPVFETYLWPPLRAHSRDLHPLWMLFRPSLLSGGVCSLLRESPCYTP